MTIAVAMLLVNIAIYYSWRRYIFDSNNLYDLLGKLGFVCQRSGLLFKLLTFWQLSIIRGVKDGVLVGAAVYGPFGVPLGHDMDAIMGPKMLYGGDRLEFIALVRTPYQIEKEINTSLENASADEPHTLVVDDSLSVDFKDIDDFNGKIIIDGKSIRVSIIGSSWLGSRFNNRVQTGYEMFTLLKAAIGSKYKYDDPSVDNLKWDGHSKQFKHI